MTKKFKPIKEFSNKGTKYYTVDYLLKGNGMALDVSEWNFDGDKVDYAALDRGIAFEKKKHAQRATTFILNLMRTSEPLPGCITSQPDEGAEVWVISLLEVANCHLIYFSQSNSAHQNFLKNHLLFSSEKDARAASKFILEALKAKVLRQNLNCLTKAPADGTIVFALSTFTPGGYIQQPFNCNESRCMRLLESGLLFTSEEDVVRAYEHLMQQINPTKPKAVPEVPAEPDVQPPCQLGAIVGAEPDAQPDMPF